MNTEAEPRPVRANLPRALTVAGSDPSGGAGLQADLKTFTALGVYGMAVVTALTVQNTQTVKAVRPVGGELVAEQMTACLDDVGADSIKLGMLWNREIILNVLSVLRARRPGPPLIVDPVLASGTGRRLIEPDAIGLLAEKIFPLATLVTPNAAEAEALSGRRIITMHDMGLAAREILRSGPQAVLIKGGHLSGKPIDLFFDGRDRIYLESDRVRLDATHGTGCALSAAIAAYLARGEPLLDAVQQAKEFVTQALRAAVRVGQGAVPPNHMWAIGALAAARPSRPGDRPGAGPPPGRRRRPPRDREPR